MIVIDTSALMAMVLGESAADDCRAIIDRHPQILIAAPSVTETLIVASGRKVHGEMTRLFADLALTVIPFTEERARRAAEAYRTWGKGYHPAALNLGDTFAYALAIEQGCPLLYVGNDFARTDVVSALA